MRVSREERIQGIIDPYFQLAIKEAYRVRRSYMRSLKRSIRDSVRMVSPHGAW